MNTNTNVTSYMPESFWTIIPIFFYTARTVYNSPYAKVEKIDAKYIV